MPVAPAKDTDTAKAIGFILNRAVLRLFVGFIRVDSPSLLTQWLMKKLLLNSHFLFALTVNVRMLDLYK